MAILTKEDVYNKIISQEKPQCPHCGVTMVIWECPPMSFADGLGWGTPFLYVCFNDDCSLYVNGWKSIMENYARHASYRCICDPTSKSGAMDCMTVFGAEGGAGSIVDEECRAEEKAREETCEKGLKQLEGLFDDGNADAILKVLVAEDTLPEIACRAAELMSQIGTLEAIEPIKNKAFQDGAVRQKAETAVKAIHERNYTRECPFCAEIIKARAVVCKHCGKNLG